MAICGAGHTDRSGVMARTAKEELSESVDVIRCIAGRGAQEKGTGTVAEQAAQFAGHAAGSEDAAVNVRTENEYGARLSRSNESLGDGEAVQQAEPGAIRRRGVANLRPACERLRRTCRDSW